MPEVIDLAYDEAGLLYEPRSRKVLEWAVAPEHLAAAETLVVLGSIRPRLDSFGAAMNARYGGIRMKVLSRLRRHPDGIRLKALDEHVDVDDPAGLAAAECAGELTCSPAPGGAVLVRLTGEGHRAMDERLRRIAAEESVLVAGIDPGTLPVVRHVCLRMAANRDADFQRELLEVSGGTESVEPRLRLESDDGLLYEPGLRAYVGPLDPAQLLTYETMAAVRRTAFRLNRFAHRVHRATRLTRAELRRKLTDELTVTVDGIAAGQLPPVRDACWRISANIPRP